jgi:hypothetical protein
VQAGRQTRTKKEWLAWLEEFSLGPLLVVAEPQQDGSSVELAETGRSSAGTKVLLADRNLVLERMNHAAHSELGRTFQNETQTGYCFFFLYRLIQSELEGLGLL